METLKSWSPEGICANKNGHRDALRSCLAMQNEPAL